MCKIRLILNIFFFLALFKITLNIHSKLLICFLDKTLNIIYGAVNNRLINKVNNKSVINTRRKRKQNAFMAKR